ncbi:GA2L1 protein, partial [Alcedo cyanopectus]|nr:GA2L1 protein [Ceyx cyanopectus]
APRGSGAGEALELELEELGRRLRAPLRLEPGQEQQLFRRLEEEFLANTRMMEEMEDGENPPAAAPPPPTAAADSAYCSSSSSSSSLNVFAKHGLPAEDGRRSGNGGPTQASSNPDVVDLGRQLVLSSSSDESSCFPTSWDARETRGGPESDTDWAPGEDELTEMEEPDGPPGVPEPVPSLPATPPRPWAKPRLDTQPHKKPSRIPTPRGSGAAPRLPTSSPKCWGPLQNVLSSFLEPAWGPRECEGLDEDAWP